MTSKFLTALSASRFINKTSLKNYHFKADDYTQNVFGHEMSENHVAMFDSGSGKELKTKATAVYSSSMLAYNFFHWISPKVTFKYGETIYDKVVFEVKIPTISKSPAPANMDVVLVSKDKSKWLLIESKFTEYVHRSAREMLNLSLGYLYQDRYFFNVKSQNADIVRLVKDWYDKASQDSKDVKKKKYYDGIKQLLCHIIAMKNLMDPSAHSAIEKKFLSQNQFLTREEFHELKTIEFITLIFDPLSNFEEHNAYVEYKSLCEDFGVTAKNIFSSFDVVTYSQMWNRMEDQIDDCKLREYLRDRYMQFAGA